MSARDIENAIKATLVAQFADCISESSEDEDEEPREWVKPWIMQRDDPTISHVFRDIEETDEAKFIQAFRMNPRIFYELLHLVEPHIAKQDTPMRSTISPKVRLQITLRYLASGANFGVLQELFRVGKSTISGIIPEVCLAIWNVLSPDFLRCPKTQDEWLEKANEFCQKWQYPRALGALDGKHIHCQCFRESGSAFRNYKQTFSFILLALADAKTRFVYVDIGHPGASNDSGIFHKTDFYQAMCDGSLNLPGRPVNEPDVGYHFIGDDAFGLNNVMFKPYSERGLTRQQAVFNYRFSRARRTVESAFGLMATRFRIFRSPILQDYDNAVKTVQAAVVLHNFLLDKTPVNQLPVEQAQNDVSEESQLVSLANQAGNRSGSNSARAERDRLATWFVTEGAVDWQWDVVDRKSN